MLVKNLVMRDLDKLEGSFLSINELDTSCNEFECLILAVIKNHLLLILLKNFLDQIIEKLDNEVGAIFQALPLV